MYILILSIIGHISLAPLGQMYTKTYDIRTGIAKKKRKNNTCLYFANMLRTIKDIFYKSSSSMINKSLFF